MFSVNLKDERVGLVGKNNYGSKMEIIEYNRAGDMWVKFNQGRAVHTNWKAFLIGDVRNVYDKSVFGIGFLGEGEYKTSINKKQTPQYSSWKGLMERCYSESSLLKNTSYIGCSVSEEWHNFQNYGKWYDDNYYQITGQKMQLDKDILSKGNKVYSPDTCVFVPQRINLLFIKKDRSSKDYLPTGVVWYERYKKYQVSCNDGKGNLVYLGRYSSVEEAFKEYKVFKEKAIKNVAEEYKEKIPTKLYNAMMNYVVEITD
jgi:hypothetical protein